MIKFLQGSAIPIAVNNPTQVDYKMQSLQDNMNVHAIVLQICGSIPALHADILLSDILKNIDIQVVKDSNKTLVDCNAFDLHVINQLDNKIQITTPTLQAEDSFTWHIVIPFSHFGRARAKDTSLVVKACQQLNIKLNNHNLATDVVMVENVETMVIYEDDNKVLINSERYIQKQGVSISGAVANFNIPLAKYPYTRMIIQSNSDIPDITRLDLFGSQGIIAQGEPDEVQFCGFFVNKHDGFYEYQIADTPEYLSSEIIVIPFLNYLNDNLSQVEETELKLMLTTGAAFSGNIIVESISTPSRRRIERAGRKLYPSIPANKLMLGAVNADGSVEFNPYVWTKRSNLTSLVLAPVDLVTTSGKTASANDILTDYRNRLG